MCVVSMVIDHYGDKWKRDYPLNPNSPAKEEFDQLRREVQDLRDLLLKSKKYDEEHGEPDCLKEEEKLELIKKVAEAVGIDIGL